MKKVIIEGDEEVRIIWYLEKTMYPYYLEVITQDKGWRPIMTYPTILKALASMEAWMEDHKRKEEE